LDKFFTFITLQGTIEEKYVQLCKMSNNPTLLQSYLIRFINTLERTNPFVPAATANYLN